MRAETEVDQGSIALHEEGSIGPQGDLNPHAKRIKSECKEGPIEVFCVTDLCALFVLIDARFHPHRVAFDATSFPDFLSFFLASTSLPTPITTCSISDWLPVADSFPPDGRMGSDWFPIEYRCASDMCQFA